MLERMLGLAPGKRVLYVPTASNEDPARTIDWYEREVIASAPGAGSYRVEPEGEGSFG